MSDGSDSTPVDSSSSRPAGRRSRWRWLRRAGVGVLVLLVAIYLLRGPLLARPLARLVGDRLSGATGLVVEVDRVDGTLLSDVVLSGVRARASHRTLRRMDCDRVRVRFDVVDLLRRGPLAAIRAIEARGVDVELDPTAVDEAATEPAVATTSNWLDSIPDPLPISSISARVQWRGNGGIGRANGLTLRGDGDRVDVEVERLDLPRDGVAGAPLACGLSIERLAPREFRVRSIRPLDGLTLDDARVAFPADGGVAATFSGRLRNSRIEGALRERTLTCHTDGLDLSALPRWLGDFLGTADELPHGGTLAADLSVTPLGGAIAEIRGTATVHDLRWRDAALDVVAIAGVWSGGHGSVDSLSVTRGSAHVDATGVSVDAAVPWFVSRVEHAKVAVPEVDEVAHWLSLGSEVPQSLARVRGVDVELTSEDGRRVTVARGTVALIDVTCDVTGTAILPARPDAWRETDVGLRIAAENWDLETTLSTVGALPPVRGRVDVIARIDGRIAAPRAFATLAARDLLVAGHAFEHASAEIDVQWPRARVTCIEVHASEGSITGTAVADLERQQITGGTFDADITTLGPLVALAGEAPQLHGRARVHGVIRRLGRDQVALDAAITADALELERVAVGSLSARANLDWPRLQVADLRVDGPSGTADGAIELDVRDVASTSGHATFALETPGVRAILGSISGAPVMADATRLDGHLTRSADAPPGSWDGDVRLHCPRLTVAGRTFDDVDAHATFRDGGRQVPNFTLQWNGGRVEGAAAIGAHSSLSADGTDVDLSGIVAGLGGRASFHLSASGSAAHPEIAARVDCDTVTFESLTARVGFTVRQSAGVMSIQSLLIDGPEVHVEGTLDVPCEVGTEGVRLTDGVGLAAAIVGRTTLLARSSPAVDAFPFSVHDVEFRIDAAGDAMTATVAGRDPGWIDAGHATRLAGGLRIAARWTPEVANVDVVLGDGGPALVTLRAESKVSFDLVRLRESIASLVRAPMRGSVTFTIPELASFERLIPDVERLSGSATGHVDFEGTASDPRLAGEATLGPASIRFKTDAPAIDATARLRLADRRVTIDGFEGRVGYAPVFAHGAITFTDARNPTVELETSGENVLLTRSADLRIRADVQATIAGPFDAMKVTGVVRVTDAVYSRPIDPVADATPLVDENFRPFQLRDKPLNGMRFDVRGTASESVRIDNGLVRTVLSGDVRLRGTGEAPRLEGRIATKTGSIRLPFARLKIDQAEIVFRPEDGFAPKLEATAHTRVKTYDLAVRASGVIPDVELVVASLPPLPQQNAFLLLAAGVAPSDLPSGAATWSTLRQTGTLAGTKLLSSLMESADDDEETALDRFSFETGRDGTQGGTTTIDAEFKLSEHLFLRAERDRFEGNNVGFVWRLRFR